VGYVGLPDLHRRPGRPSGMPERLIPAPTHQMQGPIEFDIGIGFSASLDANQLFRDYATFAVDPIYCQNQDIDPTFFLISYFPINAWPTPLPREFSLACLEDSAASFGTLIKSDGTDDYILRLFNAESATVNTGTLSLGPDLHVVASTDLVEETRNEMSRLAAQLQPGELLNLVIEQKVKE
jgi:mannosylglycerate hydrolase